MTMKLLERESPSGFRGSSPAIVRHTLPIWGSLSGESQGCTGCRSARCYGSTASVRATYQVSAAPAQAIAKAASTAVTATFHEPWHVLIGHPRATRPVAPELCQRRLTAENERLNHPDERRGAHGVP